jgi:hypothetical protein
MEQQNEPPDRQPKWDMLWDVPLAILSWLFFHINKTIIAGIYQIHLNRSLSRSVTWLILSGETIKKPIILPLLLTKGPRWNTHAIIGTLGPLTVSNTIAVQTEMANRSAENWTIVVYRYPDFKTWTQLSSSSDASQQQEWSTITLPQGKYSLGVRYYGVKENASMPDIEVDRLLDSITLIKGVPVNSAANDFYTTLAERTNTYSYALHYYVHTMLRLRYFLPQQFVRNEYLPVGDPDTLFLYDWFPAHTILELHVNQQKLNDHWIYLSAYNRASLPICSQRVSQAAQVTPALRCAGFYLVRVRPKDARSATFQADDLTVIRLPAASPANRSGAEPPS